MVTIDKKRFREIFRKVFRSYGEGVGIFAKLRSENFGPQNIQRPKGVGLGSHDHIYWLSLVALSDKRTNSSVLYRCFARMFTKNPTLFRRGFYPSLMRMTKLFRRYTIALPVKEIGFFLAKAQEQISLLDQGARADDCRPFDRVAKLSHVTGPFVVKKGLHSFGTEAA